MARSFDAVASRDLEYIEQASDHFRQAWRALTPLGSRHVFAVELVLETAAMMGMLSAERRRIEAEQRV